MHPALRETDHRPWPLPSGRWSMTQTWSDLLFAHWRVPVDRLQALIPAAFEVEAYDGTGWVGIVPFRMSGVRPRLLPPVPGLSYFPELNVRTYVRPRGGDKPGVWFFSLEAANRAAVWIARRRFHLPYFRAAMTCRREEDRIVYRSRRTHGGATAAAFEGTYGPSGGERPARLGTLAHWLTERYALYTVDGAGRPCIGEIHHAPWPLQDAQAEIAVNTMAAAAGLELPDEAPLLHFARRLDVAVWSLRRLGP